MSKSNGVKPVLKTKYLTGRVRVLNKYNHADMSGEYEGGGTFRFKLKSPVHFMDVNAKLVVYTHVELEIGGWSDTPAYVNKNKQQRIAVRPVPRQLWKDMYDMLAEAEDGSGQLKDWAFSDEIYDVAHGVKRRW